MPSRIAWQAKDGSPQSAVAIYVGRPTKWGNPYKIGRLYTRQQAVMLYRRDLLANALPFTINDAINELRGKDLICWCKLGDLCHADILLEIANASIRSHP
jgi:Domain of unknown function (DUF4326)